MTLNLEGRMSGFPMTKGDVLEAFGGVQNLSKRALPTLGSILKHSRLMTLLKEPAEEANNVRTVTLAAVEHITNPQTGQDIWKSPDTVQKLLTEALDTPSDFKDPGIRITEADLPRLPEFSDDPEKHKKYLAAREALANEVAALGPLFSYEEPKS